MLQLSVLLFFSTCDACFPLAAPRTCVRVVCPICCFAPQYDQDGCLCCGCCWRAACASRRTALLAAALESCLVGWVLGFRGLTLNTQRARISPLYRWNASTVRGLVVSADLLLPFTCGRTFVAATRNALFRCLTHELCNHKPHGGFLGWSTSRGWGLNLALLRG